jgi:hypothetical protein
MLFSSTKAKPEEVFTPRMAEVNSDMYVTRPLLERALKTALRGNMHMIIHGESGTGKSWLYKKNLQDLGVPFVVANLANASRMGSIAAELQNLVDRDGHATKVGYEEEKAAEIGVGVAKGGVSHTNQYELGKKEPFEECLSFLHHRSNGKNGVLVLDNLEAAFTPELLKELADLLILCDDERYAIYGIKILVVGVPSGVKEYFYKTPHHKTVANRLSELPEVTRLEPTECDRLVKRGFIEKLKFNVVDIDALVRHVSWISDRVPQMIHEYCLELAFIGEDSSSISENEVNEADLAWLSKSMHYAYSAIESHMNERDTKAGRRNQTLYALSLCEGEQFKSLEIEEIVRKEFTVSTENTTLNIAQVLSQLSKGERPLVKRSPKGDAFTFVDPRYRVVLRTMLFKTPDERVEKKPISRI